jgi:hypothetical protein
MTDTTMTTAVQSREERDRMDIRAYAARHTLEGTNRILGLHDNKVLILRPGKDHESIEAVPPAWTDGRLITINGFVDPVYTALRDGWTEEDIFLVTALNYHELAHCFFMPRLGDDLMQRIKDDGYWQAWNILQDMHDETLFVGRYRPATNYFIRIAVEFFARTKHQIDTNYVLVAGRKFLPEELRTYFLDNFSRPDVIGDIDRIANDYVKTVYPRDEKQMYDLVKEYHELLEDLHPEGASGMVQVSEHQEGGGDPQGPSQGPMVPVHGKTIDEEEQESASKKAERQGQQSAQGRADGDGDDEDDEGAGGSDAGQTHERPSLDNILDDVSQRATVDVAHELEERSKAFDHAAQDYKLDIDPLPYRELNLDDDTAESSRRVEQALRRLKEDFDPGWHRAESEGRLDFGRVIGHQLRGDVDVFKRWDEGITDVLDIEAVIACDLSGSMASLTKPTGKALWAMHTALRAHDAQVTVLGYNTDVFLLRQRGEQPESFVREYGAGGGTSVCPAILEANKVFAASRRALKLLFIISDGAWFDQSEAQDLLAKPPYRVFVIGLGYDVAEYARMGSVEVARTINDIVELPSLFRDIVTGVARHRAETMKMRGR